MDTAAVLDREVEQEIDPIEEMRLRTWARQNYLPPEERHGDLHPVVIDEMRRKDHEHR